MEICVDDMLVKSLVAKDHVAHLDKMFQKFAKVSNEIQSVKMHIQSRFR